MEVARRENLRERAFMLRVKMLHQNEAHSGAGWQMLQQLRGRLQTARDAPIPTRGSLV